MNDLPETLPRCREDAEKIYADVRERLDRVELCINLALESITRSQLEIARLIERLQIREAYLAGN